MEVKKRSPGERCSGALFLAVIALTPSRAIAEEPPPVASRSVQGAAPDTGTVASPASYIPAEPSAFGPRYRSPGLAAALSLTPLPVDFGNLYAENVSWGIGYTVGEVALAGGMMWLGADHMCHDSGCSGWSGGETAAMIAMVAGYVGIKTVAGVHAASAARSFDATHGVVGWQPLILPAHDGAVVGIAARF